MATFRQKTAAAKTFEALGNNRAKTLGEILRESDYSVGVSLSPKIVTETKGYKTELEKLLKEYKIDKNSRLKRMAEILYDKDKRSSIAANGEISKMLGDYAPVKQEIDDLRDKREELVKPE